MGALAILQLLSGLFSQLAPLVEEVIAANSSNDQATLDATLAKLQALNDLLAAPAPPPT